MTEFERAVVKFSQLSYWNGPECKRTYQDCHWKSRRMMEAYHREVAYTVVFGGGLNYYKNLRRCRKRNGI